jgi:phosphomannomutase/phosphoglucomutase
MSIFRAYDIRGVYEKDFDESLFERIGREFSRFMKVKEMMVGCDVRLSSPSLKAAFIRGARGAGSDVVDVGTVPTPVLYFAVAHFGKTAGAMITASHNPPEYNGVKLVGKGAVALSYETGIEAIEKAVAGKKRAGRIGRGNLSMLDVSKAYVSHALEKIDLKKRLRVVVDAGNGACGELAPLLLENAGCEAIRLFCELDGRFPNHFPDPGNEANLRWLTERVKKERADFGVAMDGDGDRAVFVDERGSIVRGDMALGIFARELFRKKRGAKVIYEVKCSRGLIEMLEKEGGRGIMSRTGHSYIHNLLSEERADIAGEMSGHYYFAENYGYDDALYAAVKMAEVVSKRGRLSELAKKIPQYVATPEYRIAYPDEEKFAAVEAISKALRAKYGKRAITIDGVRLELPRSWGLVRASNTEPALIIRFEGKTEKDLREIRGIFGKEFARFKITLPS